MKTGTKIAVIFASSVLLAGCTDREVEARKAKEEADAKARAAAARKEMDTLPKTFQSRDIFKKNEPEKQPAPTPAAVPTKK